MKGCLSFAIVERMAAGQPVQQACEDVLRAHAEKLERLGGECGSMSVIAMDRKGNIGAATNLDRFPFVAGRYTGEHKLMTVKNCMKNVIQA